MVKERRTELDLVLSAAAHPIRGPMIERLTGLSALFSWTLRYPRFGEGAFDALASKVREKEMKKNV